MKFFKITFFRWNIDYKIYLIYLLTQGKKGWKYVPQSSAPCSCSIRVIFTNFMLYVLEFFLQKHNKNMFKNIKNMLTLKNNKNNIIESNLQQKGILKTRWCNLLRTREVLNDTRIMAGSSSKKEWNRENAKASDASKAHMVNSSCCIFFLS